MSNDVDAERRRIADEVDALDVKHDQAYRVALAELKRKREALQAECGALGHFYVKPAGCRHVVHCAFCRKFNEDTNGLDHSN